MTAAKGVLLAGGLGSRLQPATQAAHKHLLPVYDKPMVYYPLSVLMWAGIRQICVVVEPESAPRYRALLGDGADLGLSLSYLEQPEPRGLADAVLRCRSFVGSGRFAVILGDNLFDGRKLAGRLRAELDDAESPCTLFARRVDDPRSYGVVSLDDSGSAFAIEEKPSEPQSNLAVTGLYVYEAQAAVVASTLHPSARGELEITELNRHYVVAGRARVVRLEDDAVWTDLGTPDHLLAAAGLIRRLGTQGRHLGVLEAAAFHHGWIGARELLQRADVLGACRYANTLRELASSES